MIPHGNPPGFTIKIRECEISAWIPGVAPVVHEVEVEAGAGLRRTLHLLRETDPKECQKSLVQFVYSEYTLKIVQAFFEIQHTVCPGSSYPFYIVSYYIKWVTTSWTYGMFETVVIIRNFFIGSGPVKKPDLTLIQH